MLIPILKPTDYRSKDSLFYKDSLLTTPSSPTIAYGSVSGKMISYQRANSLAEYDYMISEMREEAYANLETKVSVNYEIETINNSKLAVLEGHPFCAEKMMDQSFMEKLSYDLGATKIMVGVPFQGLLLAINASNNNLRMTFPSIVKKYFNNPSNKAISEFIFLLNKGKIIGMGGEDIELDEKNDFFHIIDLSISNNFKVELYSDNVDQILVDAFEAFNQIIQLILPRGQFGGIIDFHIKQNDISLDRNLISNCKNYILNVNQNKKVQSLVKSSTGNNLTCNFYYQETLIAGKGIPSEAWKNVWSDN